jgi:hypothetical protein
VLLTVGTVKAAKFLFRAKPRHSKLPQRWHTSRSGAGRQDGPAGCGPARKATGPSPFCASDAIGQITRVNGSGR